MSHFTKKGLLLKEGDKVKWDGLPALVVAVAVEDVECPYRVFSETHEISGWVAGEVLELVARAEYEEAEDDDSLRIGDLVDSPSGLGVVLYIDHADDDYPYCIGVFGHSDTVWFTEDDVTHVGCPDYGVEVANEA